MCTKKKMTWLMPGRFLSNGILCRNFASQSVRQRYDQLVARGQLLSDPHQVKVINSLEGLQGNLLGYEPPSKHVSAWTWISRSKPSPSTVKGLYMYGGVGRGKTMLMDLFFDTTVVTKKLRTHFHPFMLDVHQKIHQFKLNHTQKRGKGPHAYDPITPVAQAIVKDVHLLCFDEFQVTDIADAMILRRLFEVLFDSGVVIVATSNRHPDDLYKNGLQRRNFLPFIAILKKNCSLLCLSSGVDYRRSVLSTEDVYLSSNTHDKNQKLQQLFDELVSQSDNPVGPRTMEFLGRKLFVPKACGSIAFFTFSDLCTQPLSAVDYLELCKYFDVIFIQDIPSMSLVNRMEARRFITLVDTLYDSKVKIVCSAEVPPEGLFKAGIQNSHDHQLMDDLGIIKNTEDAKASIFTGEEELFAFERTISRLIEMQGQEYWNSKRKDPTLKKRDS